MRRPLDVTCPACERDERALHAWRSVGGVMPPATCKKVHGVRCRDCNKRLTRNTSRRCDKCFDLWWKATRGYT